MSRTGIKRIQYALHPGSAWIVMNPKKCTFFLEKVSPPDCPSGHLGSSSNSPLWPQNLHFLFGKMYTPGSPWAPREKQSYPPQPGSHWAAFCRTAPAPLATASKRASCPSGTTERSTAVVFQGSPPHPLRHWLQL